MVVLPFSTEILQFFYNFRHSSGTQPITNFFISMTTIGSIVGYFALVLIIYWCIDKKLAYKTILLLFIGAVLNIVLKDLIANPRPYVSNNTYQEKWGVPGTAAKAKLATQYSTPSGHAQLSGTFYTYIFAKFQNRWVKVFSVLMVLLIGISRPYLGVHYLEDVILGWIIGILTAVVFLKYENKLNNIKISIDRRLILYGSVLVPLLVVAGVAVILGPKLKYEDIATYMGLISGLIPALMLERSSINFIPKTGIRNQVIKVLIGIPVAYIILEGLKPIFLLIAPDLSILGFLLRYLRYLIFALTVGYLLPLLFVKLNLSLQESKN